MLKTCQEIKIVNRLVNILKNICFVFDEIGNYDFEISEI